MWKCQKQVCPLCKEHWQVYPAVTIDYRDNIEKFYGEEVAQLRSTYTHEDKELIKEFQLSKRFSSGPISDLEFSSRDQEEKEIKQDSSNMDYEAQLTTEYEAKPLLSQCSHSNTGDSWYSQSAKEESKHEHIYASTTPRRKTMASQPSIEVSHIQIKKHPQSDINIKYHGRVTLSVTATGPGIKPLRYKWKRNRQDITNPKCSGVDTHTLSIEQFSSEHEGDYTCIVSDDEDNIESLSAELKLGLHITKHPQFPSTSVRYGDYVAIFVSAVGDHKSLRYSWKFNGEDIDLANCTGSNTRILVIKSSSLEHQGTYTCTVRNNRREIESNPAHLKLVMEFDSSMTTDHFFAWLKLKELSEDDLQLLKRGKILKAAIFERLTSGDIKKLELSVGGGKLVQILLDEIRDTQASESAPATSTKEHFVPQQGLKVNMHDLLLLKWRSKSGEEKQTRIIQRVRNKWKDIATLISDDDGMIDDFSKRYSNDPSECVKQVFRDCFFTRPRCGRYSQDWDGIIELLGDIEEETLADEVKEWSEIYNKTNKL